MKLFVVYAVVSTLILMFVHGFRPVVKTFGGGFLEMDEDPFSHGSFFGNSGDLPFWSKELPKSPVIIQCSPGFSLDVFEGRCVEEKKEKERKQVIQYSLQLLVHNSSLIDEEAVSDPKEWLTFAKSFQPLMNRLADAGNVSRLTYSVGMFTEIPQWWHNLTFPIYLSARMMVNVNDTNHEDYSDGVLNALGDSIPISMKGQLINLDFSIFNGSYEFQNEKDFFTDEDTGECCIEGNPSDKYEDMTVTSEELVFYEMYCPYVQLAEGDGYELVSGELMLAFGDQKTRLEGNTYTFHGDDIITICKDIYENYYNKTLYSMRMAVSSYSVGIEWTVTVICLAMSLLCLFLTFMTYCVFPSLRTVPAKNNMGLILCLFMAQLIYVTGYRESGNRLQCQMLGAALHYFWLAAIMWMNVCSFHVFKTFVIVKTVAPSSTRSYVALFRYFLYANGLPVLVVSAVITINQILSEGRETGYGSRVCFLSTPLLIALTAVLPLCIALLSNFVFYTATICTIHKTKQIQRSTGGERQNLWIYIKLSSITGLFWMFAVLEGILDIEALTYISIVLNSGQGVFLFFSYCCNKRIMSLWKKQLTGRERDTSASVNTGGTKPLNRNETESTSVNTHFDKK